MAAQQSTPGHDRRKDQRSNRSFELVRAGQGGQAARQTLTLAEAFRFIIRRSTPTTSHGHPKDVNQEGRRPPSIFEGDKGRNSARPDLRFRRVGATTRKTTEGVPHPNSTLQGRQLRRDDTIIQKQKRTRVRHGTKLTAQRQKQAQHQRAR